MPKWDVTGLSQCKLCKLLCKFPCLLVLRLNCINVSVNSSCLYKCDALVKSSSPNDCWDPGSDGVVEVEVVCWYNSTSAPPTGSFVPDDDWHAGPVRSGASEKTGAGGSGAGEEGTDGAPQGSAAHQESASCQPNSHRSTPGGAADHRGTHRHKTTAEGGVFTPVCDWKSSTSTPQKGGGRAQRWEQKSDPG